MSDNRAILEIIAPTVEEAIAKGLNELGLPEEAVEVEVLDEGSRGLFGLGSRQARIRLAIRGASSPKPEIIETGASEPVEMDTGFDEEEEEELGSPAMTESKPGAQLTIDAQEVLDIANDTVTELLKRMRVHASVAVRYGEPDDARSRAPILVDITGRDLSVLIGRQAETLNALQYISTLIVSKEAGRSVTLVVDVQGYRQRREQQIRQLARRIADQAVKTGRKQILEPMPASERRIVHIELRDNPYVTTESIGEEPRRKVTILPK